MSDISGPGGNVTLPTNFNCHISGWSGTDNVTTVETTGFAEVGNRTYDATALVWTGSAVGTGQTGNSGVIPAGALGATPTFSSYKGTLVLTAASGNSFSMTAVITNIAFGRVHDGKLDVAFNFVSSGPITPTWS